MHRLPSFRELFKTRRCLVPADGFYEWKKLGKERLPYFFSMASGEPFALAGIYDRDQFTLITTAANQLVAETHDRMPVIVPREGYDEWLRQDTPVDKLKKLLSPYAAEEMKSWPVSKRVNKAEPDDEGLIQRVEGERGLF